MVETVLKPHVIEKSGPVIRIKIMGDQEPKFVIERRKQIDELLATFRGPKNILYDITDTCVADEVTRNEVVKSFKQFQFKKLAVFSSTPESLCLSKSILQNFGNDPNVKLFRSEEAALNWLGVKPE